MYGYLDLVGYRLLDGFDISGRYALELPDALLRAIRTAVDGDGAEDSDVEAQHRRRSARKVPEEHRAEFDELLGEARLTYRLRDERGVFSDIWASGHHAPRRARRPAAGSPRKGRIHDAEHFVDAGFDEMCALVAGAGGPSADELAARAEYRTSHTPRTRRRSLGPPPPPPPDPSGLPPAVGRVMRAIGHRARRAVRQLRGGARGAPAARARGERRRLRGAGAPRLRPAEFDRIVQGDVLVTESTTEAFNILLPLLGAIVTDSGGLLSHSAIVAREYGIPGVVGTREATERIADGARVRVDGDAGEVTVLA